MDPSLQVVSDVVERAIDSGRLPGAVLAVERGDRLLCLNAWGDQQPGSASMTVDALFRIYSMTKPITSVAVLMLLERAALRLSDPVSTYLPEFASLWVGHETVDRAGLPILRRVPSTQPMRIIDLLRHTSGLTYGSFERSLVKDAYLAAGVERSHLSNAQLSAALAELPLVAEPGSLWEYSRSTDVLGAVIEKISGQSLGVFLKDNIFGPLGMVDTGFYVPQSQWHRIAEPFNKDPDSGEPVRLKNVREPPVSESGGGGLVSSVHDYLRFQRALLNDTLLTAKTFASMTQDHLGEIARGAVYYPGPDFGFGLGVAVRTRAGIEGPVGEFYWNGLGGTAQWIEPVSRLKVVWMVQAPNQRDELFHLIRTTLARAL